MKPIKLLLFLAIMAVSMGVNAQTNNTVRGDVNGDSAVNAADIVSIVNIIMGGGSNVSNPLKSDVNGDGAVNATDIVVVVNIIMGIDPGDTPGVAEGMVLQVLLSDGQTVSINLNEEPRTTYQEGNLVITSTKNTVTYPLERVRRFTYATATGVGSPKMVGASFSNDGKTLYLRGLKPHTKIYLYNVAGELLNTIDSGEQSLTVISTSRMPIGEYVVKVNGGTYIITKR